MGRYDVMDVHVTFGDPGRGYWLHSPAPKAISPDASRTLCGKVMVKGVDDIVRAENWPDATHCPDCVEIRELCDRLEAVEAEHGMVTDEHRRLQYEVEDRRRRATTGRTSPSHRRRASDWGRNR